MRKIIQGLSLIGLTVSVATASLIQLPIEKQVSILSNKIHEACFSLKRHQQVAFSFKATDPVLFNIHYHEGKEVNYPIADQLTPEFKSTVFTAPVDQIYCLMWTNKQPMTVSINYQAGHLNNG